MAAQRGRLGVSEGGVAGKRKGGGDGVMGPKVDPQGPEFLFMFPFSFFPHVFKLPISDPRTCGCSLFVLLGDCLALAIQGLLGDIKRTSRCRRRAW